MPIITNTRIGRLKSTTSLSVLSVLCLGLCSATLQGQTRFRVHDTTPALPRYLSAEECLAAVSRTSDSVALARPVFPDTMPFRKGEGRDSISASAVAIAQQCAVKFHPDSVNITGYVESYTDWMQLYLLANRDDAAEVVAQRRIANARQQPKSPREMYDVLIGAMTVYGNVRPMRWEKIKATRVQIEAPGVVPDPMALYRAYFLQYRFAETFGDTIVQTDLAERMVAMAKMAPPEIKNSRDFAMVRYVTFMLTSFLTRTERMDSLQAGPGAYVALSRAQWEKIAEESKLPIPQMIGEQAAAVTADFWFTANNGPNNATKADASSKALTDQSGLVRPSPGKVALVVFMRQGCSARTASFFGLLDRGTYWDRAGQLMRSYAVLVSGFPGLKLQSLHGLQVTSVTRA